MSGLLHIACLQTEARADARAALGHALDLARDAVSRGASLLVLPEYCGGLKTEGRSFVPPVFEEKDHPVLQGLAAFAADNDVWILVGSVAVAGSTGKFINRSVMLDNKGATVARYDKLHLFDVMLSAEQEYRESDQVEHGKEAVLVDTPWATAGLSICYDLRFPMLYRELAQAGAELLFTPAAFTKKTGQYHWHVLNRARAIENGAYVIAACATGKVEGGGESYGHSLIVDPWGEIVAEAGEQPEVIIAELDIARVASARSRIPSLKHDKPYRLSQDQQQQQAS